MLGTTSAPVRRPRSASRRLLGNPDNVVELMKQDDIDGALVGGASLEAASFAKLARFAELE